MPTVLIGDIYRIEGQTFAGGSSIPTGTALTRAALRSEDPDANDFAASTESLFLFDRATNDIRTRPAEEIDFFVDGVLISRETPDLETTALNTNLGRLNGLTFVVDGDTYFLPRNEGPLDGTLDTITAPSSVGSFLPVTGISLLQHGLQIPGSTEYEGQVFGRGAADVAGLGLTRSATDSDDTPLNTGESTERTDFTAEVLVTVTFDDGQTLSNVRAYGDIGFGPFFVGDLSAFAVEVAAIQATGRTLDNVVDADFQSFTSHDLTYAEVGFEAISGVTDMSVDDNTPPDPQPEPPVMLIEGDAGRNRLKGTASDEIIVGGAGRDVMFGNGGSDTFVFGADAANGRRERDVIRDFSAADDVLLLTNGAEIRNFKSRNDDLIIRLQEDRDQIVLRDFEGDFDDLNIVFQDNAFSFA